MPFTLPRLSLLKSNRHYHTTPPSTTSTSITHNTTIFESRSPTGHLFMRIAARTRNLFTPNSSTRSKDSETVPLFVKGRYDDDARSLCVVSEEELDVACLRGGVVRDLDAGRWVWEGVVDDNDEGEKGWDEEDDEEDEGLWWVSARS